MFDSNLCRRNFRFVLGLLVLVAWQSSPVLAQRGLKDIPDIDPQVERNSFVMSEGLSANLFAGDQEIAKPIQINFDGRGRLWVAGSNIYPHIKPGQEANDKIYVLEDSNGDGVVDKQTIFADGLLIPTGVLPDEKGGCYVANSTELIYLADDDGDGVSDRKQTILSGFGTEDTHHLLHTLRWAPDGSLFMNQSIYIHSHVETPTGVKHMNGGGLWRFRPDNLQLETYCLGFVNPWGTAFDQWGQSFVTDGAYSEGINHVFPDSVWVTSPGATRIMTGLNPGSPKHCSLEIISGRHFPSDWQGNMITNDFRANRVCRFIVSDDGDRYSSRQATEVIRSTHVAFRPIDAKMGPDGALYIADWYNPIIQHGEVDFRDPRRDQVHGRIWRVTMEGRPLVARPDLVEMDAASLLQQLGAAEADTRLWAKRFLRNRPQQEVLTALQAAASEAISASKDSKNDQLQLELLWAGLNIDHLNRDLLDNLLKSQRAEARAAAMRICSDYLRTSEPSFVLQQCKNLIDDPAALVRLEAVTALGRLGTADAASVALQVLTERPTPALDFALWRTLRLTSGQWMPLVEAGEFDFGNNYNALIVALGATDSGNLVTPILTMLDNKKIEGTQTYLVLKEVAKLATPDQLQQLASWIDVNGKSASEKVALWSMLATANSKAPSRLPDGLSEILSNDSYEFEDVLQGAIVLAGRWNLAAAFDRIEEVLLAAANQETHPVIDDPAVAVDALTQIGTANDALRARAEDTLLKVIAASVKNQQLRDYAAAKLVVLDLDVGVREIIKLTSKDIDAESVETLAKDVLTIKGGQAKLADALADVKLPTEVARAWISEVRGSAQPSDALLNTLKAAGGLSTKGWSFNQAQLEEFLADIQDNGDPMAGELIYRRDSLQCIKCHAIGGIGSEVGPDMISIGASAPVDYLVESLLDPNSKVKEGYHSKLIQTVEGKIISGIVVRQADGVLQLRLADNSIIQLAEDDIDQIADGKSLMPEGLVDTLTRDELRDLVCFLSKLGKEEPFAIRGEPVIRAWQVLPYNNEANSRLNRTSFDTVTSGEPAFVWRDELSLVSGAVPLQDLPTYKIHANVPKTTFLRTAVEVLKPGKVRLQLEDATGVQLWIGKDPVAVSNVVEIALPEGKHWLHFAVDRQSGTELLKVHVQAVGDGAANVKLPLKL